MRDTQLPDGLISAGRVKPVASVRRCRVGHAAGPSVLLNSGDLRSASWSCRLKEQCRREKETNMWQTVTHNKLSGTLIELALSAQEVDCVAGTRHRAPAFSTRLIDPEVSRRLANNQLDEAIDCASDGDLYTMSDELCGPALDEGIGMI